MQAGSTVDGTVINAIQKLFIPPSFGGGAFRIVRSGKKTSPISVPLQDIEAVSGPLAALADAEGSIVVSQVGNGFYLEFRGSMGGASQSLMTVEVFESPGLDYLVRLPTNTDGMRTLMRGADESGTIDVPLDLELEIDDGLVDDQYQTLIFRKTITFLKAVPNGGRSVSPTIRYNQPLGKGDYLKHSQDSLLIGNRALRFVIGDASATEFTLNHNLIENAQTFTANATTDRLTAAEHNYQSLDPVTVSTTTTLPAPLSAANTYFVLDADEDDFQLSLTPNGAAINLTNTGTGTHSVRLRDGTTQGVGVDVWRLTGDEDRIPQEAYTVEKVSADSVKVSGFGSTPGANEYEVFVQTMGRPASYQAHPHDWDELPTPKTDFDALAARVLALENKTNAGAVLRDSRLSGDTISSQIISSFQRVYPASNSQSRSLEWPLAGAGSIRGMDFSRFSRGKQGSLVPAVHDASAESLTVPLPAVSSDFQNKVFQNNSGAAVDLPGAGGRRGRSLAASGFAACNGIAWYEVAKAPDGASTSSYYPVDFEMALIPLMPVSAEEFGYAREFGFHFGFEIALLRSTSTEGFAVLEVDIGYPKFRKTPGTPGKNLKAWDWRGAPLLSQRIDFGSTPKTHTAGVRITRELIDDADTIKAYQSVYGSESAALGDDPAGPNLALRVVLRKVDFEDDSDDPRGTLVINGMRPPEDETVPFGREIYGTAKVTK